MTERHAKMKPHRILIPILALLGALSFWAYAQPAPPAQPGGDFNELARQKLIEAYRKRGITNEVELERMVDRVLKRPATPARPAQDTPADRRPAPTTPAAPTKNTNRPATPAAPTTNTNQPATPAQTTLQAPPAPGQPTPQTPPAPGQVNPQAPPAPGAAAAPAMAEEAQPEVVYPAGEIDFPNMELLQFLDFYSELIDKTVLRPANLPQQTISIRTQTDLSRTEALQALDTVLSLNGISVIPMGEKFVKIVPTTQVNTEGQPFKDYKKEDLPEADQLVSQIVQLKYALASEVLNAITPFAKNAAGITAIDSSNILVIRDFASNVKRMLEIISKVDVAIPRDVDLEVIPIKYALAEDIAAVLGGLTSGGGGSVPGRSGSRLSSSRGGRSSSTGGIRSGGTSGRSGTSSSPTTNRPQSTSATSNRSNFQSRLQQIVQRAATGEGDGGPLLGDAQILPDLRSNTLLVFGTEEERTMVKDIVAKLDTIQPQVLIEAIIMEVSLNEDMNIGFNLAQNPKRFGDTATGFGAIRNGGNFASSITNFPSSAPDGFSYFSQLGSSWEATLNMIASDGRINVLSRPRIQTTHAVEASLFVGDTVPFVTGTFTDITGGGRSQFQNEQVGIELVVLPLINPDGLVVLEIIQNVAQLGVPVTIDGNEVPTTTERNAQSTVAVKNGDTIMLGGFISSTKSNSKSGVPFLKDIPVLGHLFRSSSRSDQRVELIVLIRPTVLETPELAALHAQKERDELTGVKHGELEILQEREKRRRALQKKIDKRMERALQERFERGSDEEGEGLADPSTPTPTP